MKSINYPSYVQFIVEYKKFNKTLDQLNNALLKNNIAPITEVPKTKYKFVSKILHRSWGNIIRISEKSGKCHGELYYYFDDQNNVYISGLYVKPKYRNNKFGSILLHKLEQLGKTLGAKHVELWVDQDSWIHDWYLSIGYSDLEKYRDSGNSIWMIKSL